MHHLFKDADLIIYAGDFVDVSIANELERIVPLVGVEGNMDFLAIPIDQNIKKNDIVFVNPESPTVLFFAKNQLLY